MLNLGLGFVCTPKYNAFQTRIDVLIRQLKLRVCFGSTPLDHIRWVFKPKSTYLPNVQNDNINVFEKLVSRDIKLLESRH